jgi:hypothetical protein
MQQNDNLAAQERERTHTKLFTVEGRQVTAFLNRDDSDALVVILQLWVASTDEQLRVALRSESDEATQEIFAALTDEAIPLIFAELKVEQLIASAGDE